MPSRPTFRWSARIASLAFDGPPSDIANQATSDVKLELKAPLFCVVWCGVVLVCFINAVFAKTIALIYYIGLEIRGGYFLEWMGLLPLNQIPIVMALYVIIALYFWKLFFQLLVMSLLRRCLTLSSRSRPHQTSNKLPRSTAKHFRCVKGSWRRIFAPRGRPELTESGFEELYITYELAEVVAQSYQAYKSSTLISNTWTNAFYVGTMVTNCWLSPIIHLSARNFPAFRRFLYICADILLGCLLTVFVHMVIFISVIFVILVDSRNQTGGNTEYAFDVPYDDVFIMDVIKGVQQTLVLSWLDVFTKLLPFVSMAGSLNHHMRLVYRQKAENTAFHVIIKHRSSSKCRHGPMFIPVVAAVPNRLYARLFKGLHWVFVAIFAWGVFILAVHLHAQHVSSHAPAVSIIGCKSSSQPWFASQFACTVLEINCYRQGITGLAQEIDEILRRVNPNGLSSLTIAHCPRLHIPSRIHQLTQLMELEITNATLVEWCMNAVISQATTPSLHMLALIRANMTALPDAIQSTDFPCWLRNLTISSSNLTTLPSDIAVEWQYLFNLFIERTQIEMIAPTLAMSGAMRMSLMGNQTHEIPDDLLTHSRFSVLSVAINLITKWPATIGSLDDLTMLLMDYTEITELPSWLLEEGQHRGKAGTTVTVSAGGSAYCRAKKASSSFIVVDESNPGLKIVCREKREEEFKAYPLSYNIRHRPI